VTEQQNFEIRGRLTALSFWHRMPGADAAELVAFIAQPPTATFATFPANH
jgi:hypothetical protein